MIYNSRIAIVARVLLIVSFITALLYVLFKTTLIIVPFILFSAVIAAVGELIIYLEKTNKEFANFLLSIKSADFSKNNAIDKRGKSFSFLKNAQNIIIDEFQSIRIDKEAHYFFLQTVVEHLNTAIISFDRTGEIILINESAKTLLHIPNLKNVFSLQAVDAPLCNYLTQLKPGNNPVLELNRNGEKLKLSMRATNFSVQGVEHKLISIQNIKSEVESTELLAWEQLLQVLTHEIMNSMTPISSLSSTLKTKADGLAGKKETSESVNDLAEGLEVIERRSLGLMNFVDNYKKINTLPSPEFKVTHISDFFSSFKMLKQEEILKKGIALRFNIKNHLPAFQLDQGLTEQVLINLVNNAADALVNCPDPLIEISAETAGNKLVIMVKDNGPGIDEENLSKIFIPFFSTKKTGSGIGLSFSKQVMRLHKGNISVDSIPGKGTRFVLEFPSE